MNDLEAFQLLRASVRLGIVEYEPWQSELLATTFHKCGDPAFRFCYGTRFEPEYLERYFHAFLLGLVASGGTIFATLDERGEPDRRAVLGWRRGSSIFPADIRQAMLDTFDVEGQKRHRWLREHTDVALASFRTQAGEPLQPGMTMRPNIMAVDTRSQKQGIGGMLLKSTLDYFDRRGFHIPYLVASTHHTARFYERALGFGRTKELHVGEYEEGAFPDGCEGLLAVVMYRTSQPVVGAVPNRRVDQLAS